MNIRDILRAHNIRYWEAGQHHHVRPGWIGVDCVYCSRNSGRVRLGFSLSRGTVSCWACGPHSTAGTLQELTGLSLAKCIELLGDVHKEAIPERTAGTLKVPAGVGKLLPAHLKYIESRRFDPDYLRKVWGVKGIGLAARLAWRLFIPIIDHGAMVSWTTRAITDNVTLRYISAKPDEEKVPAKSVLYGADYAGHSVVVHEGPTDVWRTGPGAVATLGTSFSRAQVLALSRIPRRLIVFDAGDAAQRRAKQLLDSLSAFDGRSYIAVLDAVDPCSASEREVSFLRKFLRE